MNNHKQACELGETALSDALEKIDDVDEETFRDAKSIIELLKENLSLWKEEEEQNNVEDLWTWWLVLMDETMLCVKDVSCILKKKRLWLNQIIFISTRLYLYFHFIKLVVKLW